MLSNYPDWTSDNDPLAPWNQPDCCEDFEDDNPQDDCDCDGCAAQRRQDAYEFAMEQKIDEMKEGEL